MGLPPARRMMDALCADKACEARVLQKVPVRTLSSLWYCIHLTNSAGQIFAVSLETSRAAATIAPTKGHLSVLLRPKLTCQALARCSAVVSQFLGILLNDAAPVTLFC